MIRQLTGDEALFIACPPGRDLAKHRNNMGSYVFNAGARQYSTRIDREANGVWIFRRVPS